MARVAGDLELLIVWTGERFLQTLAFGYDAADLSNHYAVIYTYETGETKYENHPYT